MIVERMPKSLNTQYAMEALFYKRLPDRVKAIAKCKSVDIQRMKTDEDNHRRISSYLGKQTSLDLIALVPFNSGLSPQNK
jgi:hypothetical protein